MTKDTDIYFDRPFNIRPMCFWAFFVALTIVVCLISHGAVLWVGLYFVCLIGIFVGLQFLKCHDKVLVFLGTSRINFIITIALCLTVALSFATTTLSYTNQKSFAGYNDLSGIVERHNLNKDGSGWFVLTNAKFGTSALSGKVAVYLNSPNQSAVSNITSTHKVTLNTQLQKAHANDYNINSGIKYTANPHSEIKSIGIDKSPRSIISRYSQDFLRKNMSLRNADLMFAMLFGDQSTLDGDLNTSFSITGLAHILAVSGLHVIIIAGMLTAVLKFCRVGRKRQLPVLAVVLLAYCYLCGFRYPIIRSSIMFLVFATRRVFLKSNDMLSSVSLAAIIILVLFPYSLVSVSFQASFVCVIGIALFMLPFSNFWKKILRVKDNGTPKMLNWLANGLAMYCTITVVWTPLMIRYFGFVPLLGVFANIFLLPLFVVTFQTSLTAVISYIVFPVLYLVNIMLDVIIAVTHWMASLPFSHITVSAEGYWFLLYYLGIILTTRFIFIRKRYKYSAAAILILIYSLSVLL